jgi:hypothetical protein
MRREGLFTLASAVVLGSALAESHLTRRLFGGMLRRIAMLPSPG